jgi:hypothetical protein
MMDVSLSDVLRLAQATELPQIRAGNTHAFNDIWIVVAQRRLFCRQYDFLERSWYTAFLNDPAGAVKFGERVVEVRGVVPADLDAINPDVNQAYIDKYDGNADYPTIAREMTGARFMARTMELVPVV